MTQSATSSLLSNSSSTSSASATASASVSALVSSPGDSGGNSNASVSPLTITAVSSTFGCSILICIVYFLGRRLVRNEAKKTPENVLTENFLNSTTRSGTSDSGGGSRNSDETAIMTTPQARSPVKSVVKKWWEEDMEEEAVHSDVLEASINMRRPSAIDRLSMILGQRSMKQEEKGEESFSQASPGLN